MRDKLNVDILFDMYQRMMIYNLEKCITIYINETANVIKQWNCGCNHIAYHQILCCYFVWSSLEYDLFIAAN